jgi:hypothetical protein
MACWCILFFVCYGIFAAVLWYVMNHYPSDEWLRKHPR